MLIEKVVCDVCGKVVDDASGGVLRWNSDTWELDVCAADQKAIDQQIRKWTRNGRAPRKRRPDALARDEWDYLEKLGFVRHRGRKSAAEVAALASRKSRT